MSIEILTWLGILFCISQSAVFSGSNLAYFSLSRLQLEVEAQHGNENAQKILRMREDSNFLLSTILWGNVSINVLLTLLSDSVLAGVSAFLFSTIAITFLGEIFPQAYFSRNALKVAALLAPVIRFYQFVLYPAARFSALILDAWLGREGISYFRENELKAIIDAHVRAEDAEVEHLEGVGALNFLSIDEISVRDEGESLDMMSVIRRPFRLDLPLLPFSEDTDFSDFVSKVHASGHKWVVFVDEENNPQVVMDADGFIRSALMDDPPVDPYRFCHRPITIRDGSASLGTAMMLLKEAHKTEDDSDDVIDQDIVLVWSEEDFRVITGADILGRLLKGIGSNPEASEPPRPAPA